MKPLSERLPLIDGAIDKLYGKWPPYVGDKSDFNRPFLIETTEIHSLGKGVYSCSDFGIHHDNDKWIAICTREEFEQRVKERRAMEKYEYMKEYLCSGVKPDLPDDVEIEILIKGQSSWLDAVVGELVWANGLRSTPDIEKFRIVDERYKPNSKKDWLGKGDRPSIGDSIDVYEDGCDVRRIIVCFVDENVVFGWDVSAPFVYAHFSRSVCTFKPTPTEEDELVERLAKTIKRAEEANTDLVLADEEYRLIASYAVKDGWRPPKSKD